MNAGDGIARRVAVREDFVAVRRKFAVLEAHDGDRTAVIVLECGDPFGLAQMFGKGRRQGHQALGVVRIGKACLMP